MFLVFSILRGVVKPFFSNKKLDSDNHISINDKGKIVNNEVKLVELFNSYFINAVEKITGKTPTSLRDSSNQQNDTNNVKKIISEYKNHPSVVTIKETYKHFGNFNLPKANPKDINKMVKSLNSKKATGPDKIPPKLVKLAANIIDRHICNILNQSISSFPEQAKIANVRPIYKKTKEKKLKTIDPCLFYHLSQKIMKNLFKSLELLLQITFSPNLYRRIEKHIAQIMFF